MLAKNSAALKSPTDVFNTLMASSDTNTTREGGKPSRLQKLLKFALHLAGLGMALAAITTIVGSINAEDDAAEALPAFPYGTLSELVDSATFMQAYRRTAMPCHLRARRRSAWVESWRAVITSSPSTLIQKRPDRMRLKINNGAHKVTLGVSHDTVVENNKGHSTRGLNHLSQGRRGRAMARATMPF
jgi:hypothetical protein